MQFPMPGKHSIINKSTTFAYVYYPYVNLLNFASFLHKSQQFFFQKKKNSGKKQKNHMPASSY